MQLSSSRKRKGRLLFCLLQSTQNFNIENVFDEMNKFQAIWIAQGLESQGGIAGESCTHIT